MTGSESEYTAITTSVHDEDGFERVYDEDDMVEIRRGDLRALLDLATGSMDFGSGFWDNEQVEIARSVADVLGVDPFTVTPSNFQWQYGCRVRGEHQWVKIDPPWRNWIRLPNGEYDRINGSIQAQWRCVVCNHTSPDGVPPTDAGERPTGQD